LSLTNAKAQATSLPQLCGKLTLTKERKMDQKIYYSVDEETGEINLDLYAMEEEAIEKLKEANPGKKVTSVYAS
jgi:hypothetical protein